MPCTVTGSFEGDARLAESEANARATRATQVACDAMRALKKAGLLHTVSDHSLEWFEEHEKIDRARIEREREQVERFRLRNEAIKKLSPEERALLGL